MKVLVTDAETRAALAVTRSLGRQGHHVLVGGKGRSAPAQCSRYCAEIVEYPDPARAPDAFVDRIAQVARDERVDAVMPVADIATFMIAAHRHTFGCAVPSPSLQVLEHAANKVQVLETARELGLPIPTGLVASGPGAVDYRALTFPIVVKPWRSRVRTPQGWASTVVSFAATAEELRRDLERRGTHEFPVLLQERIPGPGIGVFACYHQGRPVALFSHRRLRERPPWGGVSVLCESTTVDPTAGAYATQLLNAIGWQGPAMVEFKLDSRDGLPKLMEINGRFWGSLQLAIDAGVDFPALTLQTVTGAPFGPPPSYRTGVRNRWFWGDVDSLLTTLLSPRPDARAQTGRGRALREFLKLAGPDLHYDNPKRDDLRPFLAESRAWFANLAR